MYVSSLSGLKCTRTFACLSLSLSTSLSLDLSLSVPPAIGVYVMLWFTPWLIDAMQMRTVTTRTRAWRAVCLVLKLWRFVTLLQP